jgi:Flp pilus assembly protein TadB
MKNAKLLLPLSRMTNPRYLFLCGLFMLPLYAAATSSSGIPLTEAQVERVASKQKTVKKGFWHRLKAKAEAAWQSLKERLRTATDDLVRLLIIAIIVALIISIVVWLLPWPLDVLIMVIALVVLLIFLLRYLG